MLNQTIIPELRHEGAQTRKMLERVPFESFDWQPHERSATLGRLALHTAELTRWIPTILSTTEMHFATYRYVPTPVSSAQELLDLHAEKLNEALDALAAASDETLMGGWTVRRGEQVMFTTPRIVNMRNMVLNHIVHHRGQLSVYLRLLNIPVPGMYGPSADERPSSK